MYPSAELSQLARRKGALRRKIAATRLRCASLSAEAVKPLDLLDRFLVQWRKISPLVKIAALPLGLLFRRKVLHRRTRRFTRILSFLPIVLRGIRLARVHRAG